MPDLLLGGIAINEFLPDPNGESNFDTDGSGVARGGDEFVELINLSDGEIDISDVELWDSGQNNWFTFPPATFLQPGAVAVVVRNVQVGGSLPPVTGDNIAFDANFGNNVLNNTGDNLVVYDPSSNEFIQAAYNGVALDDPREGPVNAYRDFPESAVRVGDGEEFGDDTDGFSLQRTETGFTGDATPTPGAENVCFANGTVLLTPNGFQPIEQLKAGDHICTRNSGPMPIRWIFSREIKQAELLKHPSLLPVALPGSTRLQVSRHHRVLVEGKVATRMFGESEVFLSAKDMLGHCGVTLGRVAGALRYYHVLLDGHQVINANGFAAESLYLGRNGLNAMCAAARQELAAIFPATANETSFAPPRLCRPIVAGRRARRLSWRHAKNNLALAAGF